VGAACGTYGKEDKLCRILAWDIQVDYLEDACVDGKMLLKYLLIIKANKMHNFLDLFDKVLYMFRTGRLSVIRSITTMYTRSRYLSC
jgi:hypothetical protein